MDDSMKRFVAEVEQSSMAPEKKAAAIELVQRLRDGERIAVVLRDLAVPLGVTAELLLRHLIPQDTESGKTFH